MTTTAPDGLEPVDPLSFSIGIAIVVVVLAMLVALGSYLMLAFLALD